MILKALASVTENNAKNEHTLKRDQSGISGVPGLSSTMLTTGGATRENDERDALTIF
jgi:hypothetical protein